MQESKKPNVLEIELAGEMLVALLQTNESVVGEVLAETQEERRYEQAFKGLADLVDELRNQHGDQYPAMLADMVAARRQELRTRLDERERLERGR